MPRVHIKSLQALATNWRGTFGETSRWHEKLKCYYKVIIDAWSYILAQEKKSCRFGSNNYVEQMIAQIVHT